MNYLTTSQIAEFNNPLAFARSRKANAAQSILQAAASTRNNPIKTGNMEESYKLVTGASERLETLRGNLTTMLDLADKGSRAGSNTRKAEEYYGKIRSLTAGFDQVVDAIRFNKEPIFTDRRIELEMDGSRNIDLDPIRMLTYGEDSLNLSQSIPSAKIAIQYFMDDQIVNDAYDVIGLELTGGSYHSDSNAALELEDGVYKIGIEYAGANSSVSIRTQTGELVTKKGDVDLSGSGSTWVDFEQGVRLNFEMQSLFTNFDKYDFESKGPANLTATMTYERMDRQVIRTEDGPALLPGAEMLYEAPLRIGESSINITEPKVAPVSPNSQALKSGNYQVEIDYQGEDSIIRLRDSFGRIRGYKFGTDLSQQGSQKIDFGNGLSFNFENNGFTTNGAKFSSTIKYTAETKSLDDFDFRDYKKKVLEAIQVVEEQQAIMAETQAKIEETNQLRNQAASGGAPNLSAFNSGSALNLISGGGGVGIFSSTSPGARFGILSEQLFQTTTALPTQANQSPEALAQMSKNGSAGSLLSTFT